LSIFGFFVELNEASNGKEYGKTVGAFDVEGSGAQGEVYGSLAGRVTLSRGGFTGFKGTS
jgi:hypothetical protein